MSVTSRTACGTLAPTRSERATCATPSATTRTATCGWCRRSTATMTSDEAAFTAAAERHRCELSVHCYRMLASFDDAEDAVQETLLRAWCSWASFDGGTLLRAWLYR